jgi:hypothetical protein
MLLRQTIRGQLAAPFRFFAATMFEMRRLELAADSTSPTERPSMSAAIAGDIGTDFSEA